MRKQTHFAAALFLFVAFFNANLPDHVTLYISTYKEIAVQEMQRSGIPASIILAQGIHESAWGKGTLAVNSNNHFGIKCKDYWTGPTYYHRDDDFDENGNLLESCFRAYDNSQDSYLDHTDFLVNSPRYKDLFSYGNTDYIRWAKGLKECGYATDPEYAEKLIKTIKKYGLDKYDRLMDKPAIASAPSYTIPPQTVNLQNIFVQGKENQIPDQTHNYETHNYEVPAAVAIPDDYQRIDFQSFFREEPIEQNEVQPIPIDYYETQESVLDKEEILPEVTETYTGYIREEINSIPVVEETNIQEVIHEEPTAYQASTVLNRESIIPAKRMKRQRNTQLSRKPRTSQTNLR